MFRVKIDMTGKRIGRWTVIEESPSRSNDRAVQWVCRCDCGTIHTVHGAILRKGESTSCGCIKREEGLVHGQCVQGRRTLEYKSYRSAHDRCTYPKMTGFADYGGRGIEFRFISFEQFIEEVGKRPSPEHSLDRIDVNGHYEPGNVRWATRIEQCSNKRSNHFVTQDGQQITIAECARRLGIRSATLTGRMYKLGWCEPCATTLPPQGRCIHLPIRTRRNVSTVTQTQEAR